MTCDAFQRQLSRSHDGVLPAREHAALSAHVAGCPECQRFQATLADSRAALRSAPTRSPDVEQEIRTVQSRLRSPQRPKVPASIIWLGAPLAAAAAVALAFFSNEPESSRLPVASGPSNTHVDYVVTGDPTAATIVYVDQDSGWLVVWASTPADSRNS